jgi:hypothetical protein
MTDSGMVPDSTRERRARYRQIPGGAYPGMDPLRGAVNYL